MVDRFQISMRDAGSMSLRQTCSDVLQKAQAFRYVCLFAPQEAAHCPAVDKLHRDEMQPIGSPIQMCARFRVIERCRRLAP